MCDIKKPGGCNGREKKFTVSIDEAFVATVMCCEECYGRLAQFGRDWIDRMVAIS